jgi:hypothetical protein
MLPVAARWWVLTDNTFWHARWDPNDFIDYFVVHIDFFVDYIDYNQLHRFLRL